MMTWRMVRAVLTGVGLTAMVVVLALGVCTTTFAQTNASVTILGTAHDFSTGGGGYYEVTAAENHCRVCHGPPAMGGPAYPVWNHTSSDSTDYDGADWMFAVGDAGMTAGWMTEDCMGCHEGDIAINDYTGNPNLPLEDVDTDGDPLNDAVYITGTEAFGANMAVHHPVDIVYDAALATLQGSLEDPALFQNPQGGGSIADTLLDYSGKLNCKSCHEQHNDRHFELVGGNPSDDPEPGATSEDHNFLKFDRLCFNCHKHDQPHDGVQHHIPGRDDPFGDLRSSDIACNLCHAVDGPGWNSCEGCHNEITRGDPWSVRGVAGTATTFVLGHHGGDRHLPYFDCAACHADPLTGILTGKNFGTDFAPSCYTCHDDQWNHHGNSPPAGLSVEGAVIDPDSGNPTIYGTVDQLIDLVAVVATNTEGDPLAYQWSFGDDSTPPMPSHDPATSHTYLDYMYRGAPVYKASVAVTDGVNAPIFTEFDVVISRADEEHAEDTWTVTPSSDAEFDITFENHSGSLVGWTDDGDLAFGIEFVGVIFWMEMWMDLDGNVFWGTGDMFFGNVQRGDPGSMDGVLFKEDGSVQTFTGSGGSPPEH